VQHRRLPLVLAALVALVLVVAPSALGIRVHVRVEGAHTTIFGAANPRVSPVVGPVLASDGTVVELTKPTPLGTLEAASVRGEFSYVLFPTSFGPYVKQIGRTAEAGSSGWVFKVNGASPPVGADSYVLEDGDSVLWYYATFGPSGGPETLDLVRTGSCYRAVSVDDAGASSPARRVTFRLDGRRIYSFGGQLCPTGHWHELRVTKPGSIRSEVVRHP
jgi:hypothetical protein